MHDEVDLDLRVGTTDGADAGLYRLVDAASLATTAGPADVRQDLVTGLSLVVAVTGPGAVEQVAATTAWAPSHIRVEILLRDADPAVTRGLDLLAWPWSTVDVPQGGGSLLDRAVALDHLSARASGEFVVIPDAGASDGLPAQLANLRDALRLMWVEGADALVIDAPAAPVEAPVPAPGARGGRDGGRATRLATGLGLRRGDPSGLVVLRRWVARFLFDELGRAVDPLHELSERVRLLELRLVAVVEST